MLTIDTWKILIVLTSLEVRHLRAFGRTPHTRTLTAHTELYHNVLERGMCIVLTDSETRITKLWNVKFELHSCYDGGTYGSTEVYNHRIESGD